MSVQQKEFYLQFVEKEKLAKDTYSFYFDQAGLDLNFLPGQYIRMILNIKNPDNRGNSRPFTISSSPLEKNHITITTKIIKSSFKKRMAELVAGEKVKFFGPMGGFVFKDNDKENKVFLAGGIGITPFHSMITYGHEKNLSIPITLFVSFSTVEDMVFYEELSGIAKKNPYIKIIYTISHPEKSFKNSFRHSRESGNRIPSQAGNDDFEIASDGSKKSWKGETGRISEGLIKKYVPNILDPQYFIVGPPAMVAAIEEVVRGMGIASGRIFIENFTGY